MDKVKARRLRSVALNLAVAMVALVFALVAAELLVRWLIPPLTNQGTYSRPTSEPYGYDLIPNASAVVSNRPIHVNSHGFRDRERTFAKPEGIWRILVIGDSHVFGQGVRDEEIFTRLLEKQFGRPDIEVLNLGIYGYNTTQEVHLLEHRGLAYHPDVVVILYTLSDVMQSLESVPPFRAVESRAAAETKTVAKIRAERVAVHSKRFGTFGRYRHLIRRSALARLVFYRLSTLFAVRAFGNWDNLYTSDSPGWLEVQAALQHVAELAEKHGFRLLLAIHPELINLDRYPHLEVHARLKHFGDDLGIGVVDLLATYRGQDAPSLWIHPEDRHPNPRGHELIAEALEQYLQNHPILLGKAPSDSR